MGNKILQNIHKSCINLPFEVQKNPKYKLFVYKLSESYSANTTIFGQIQYFTPSVHTSCQSNSRPCKTRPRETVSTEIGTLYVNK